MRILILRPSATVSLFRKVYPSLRRYPWVSVCTNGKILIVPYQGRFCCSYYSSRRRVFLQRSSPPFSSIGSIGSSTKNTKGLPPAPYFGRGFSSSSSVNDPDNDDEDTEQEDPKQQQQYKHRHTGIAMHPESISKDILPGNVVIRTLRSGQKKPRYTELVYGYFWMLKDLKRSNEKPIQSNSKLIPEKRSKVFPTLHDLQALSSSMSDTKIQIPEYFLRKNRSRDASAQCTLVAVSFRDYGYQLLPSWIEPFQAALSQKNRRVEVFRLNISDGWLNKWILRGVIHGLMKRNTPTEEHDHTLLYFGGTAELENFRDALRMHNVLTGYVFLLDGVGRVQFAGCGPAADEEVERLARFAKELLTSQSSGPNQQQQNKRPGSSKKRRIPKGKPTR